MYDWVSVIANTKSLWVTTTIGYHADQRSPRDSSVNGKQKAEKCISFGADDVVDSSREDFVERINVLTNGVGVDLIFDPVGGDIFNRSLSCLNFGGRLLAIGFASGARGDVSIQDIALNNRSVIGVLATVPTHEMSQAMQDELYALYKLGKISPHIERTHSFEELKFFLGIQCPTSL